MARPPQGRQARRTGRSHRPAAADRVGQALARPGHAATAGAPYGRVVFLHPDTGKPTSGVPEEGQTLDAKFDQIEKWLDQNVAIGAHVADDSRPGTRTRRDINALGDLHLDWLTAKGREPDYIANRKSLLNVWVRPSSATFWSPTGTATRR
jgi:hypothetical protein